MGEIQDAAEENVPDFDPPRFDEPGEDVTDDGFPYPIPGVGNVVGINIAPDHEYEIEIVIETPDQANEAEAVGALLNQEQLLLTTINMLEQRIDELTSEVRAILREGIGAHEASVNGESELSDEGKKEINE